MDSKAKALKRLNVFKDCSNQDLEVLAAHMDEISFPRGAKLIHEGAPNHTFFVIDEGKVEVLVHGEHRRFLGPGDFFGEISMQERRPATATVVAVDPTVALLMSHEQYRALRGNPVVASRVDAALKERLAAG